MPDYTTGASSDDPVSLDQIHDWLRDLHERAADLRGRLKHLSQETAGRGKTVTVMTTSEEAQQGRPRPVPDGNIERLALRASDTLECLSEAAGHLLWLEKALSMPSEKEEQAEEAVSRHD